MVIGSVVLAGGAGAMTLFCPPTLFSWFLSIRIPFTATVLELLREVISAGFTYKIYVFLRGKSKRKFGDSIYIGYCEIAPVNYAHANQYVGIFTQNSYSDWDPTNADTIR